MTTTSEVVQQNKLREIAYGDYKAQFKMLETIFVQRREAAKLILAIDSILDAKVFIELCNKTIRDTLCL